MAFFIAPPSCPSAKTTAAAGLFASALAACGGGPAPDPATSALSVVSFSADPVLLATGTSTGYASAERTVGPTAPGTTLQALHIVTPHGPGAFFGTRPSGTLYTTVIAPNRIEILNQKNVEQATMVQALWDDATGTYIHTDDAGRTSSVKFVNLNPWAHYIALTTTQSAQFVDIGPSNSISGLSGFQTDPSALSASLSAGLRYTGSAQLIMNSNVAGPLPNGDVDQITFADDAFGAADFTIDLAAATLTGDITFDDPLGDNRSPSLDLGTFTLTLQNGVALPTGIEADVVADANPNLRGTLSGAYFGPGAEHLAATGEVGLFGGPASQPKSHGGILVIDTDRQ